MTIQWSPLPCSGQARVLVVALGLVMSVVAPDPTAAQPVHGRITNVSTAVEFGVGRISYDLGSDNPDVVFRVRLDVSQDGGETFFEVETVEGDVGLVTQGQGLLIAWSAARDTEALSPDRFQYRVVIVDEMVPVLTPGVATVEVLSEPPGATVFVGARGKG